ncbi:MAG: cation diffusion facilitator family transporter [Chloroflexota bacterium]|nr:cation diffusion facilitator family transporter [Chloroflexota bacterium]
MDRSSLTRFAWLSIGAAVLTIALKTTAYLLTGSVGLLSDALESGINLIAAVVALGALTIAARPPDDEHNFGHDKAEYFSSGVEGALILFAAVGIAYTSLQRLFNPQPLEQVGIGLFVSVAASLINFGTARILLRAGKLHHSITLEADSHHLMTDVWTSVGVIVGVGAVVVTGWLWLDPVIALLVAANITWSGVQIMRRSATGLMDSVLPAEDLHRLQSILDTYRGNGIEWHALRTRQSASRYFVSVHVLVPGEWTVKSGHDLLERLERDIRHALPQITLVTHLEPLNDPAALEDVALDRTDNP